MFVFACKGKDKEQGSSGGGGGGKLVASCDQREMQKSQSVQTCLEYVGSAWTKKEVEARCSMEGQKLIDGPCPTDGAVLTCIQMGGQPMEARMRMFGDLEKATKTCNDVGKPQ